MPTALPDASIHHYRRVLRAQAAAAAVGRRAWRRVSPDWISETWEEGLADVVSAVATAQRTAAESAVMSAPLALAAQGAWAPPTGIPDPTAVAGAAGDGRALQGLLYSPAVRAKELIGDGWATTAAMRAAGSQLTMLITTAVADAGRAAASVGIAARPRTGYVRMLNPPSCSRCMILAGKFFRWNQGFQRHPRCDCIHVPTLVTSQAEAFAHGLIDDPYQAFNDLSEAEQDRVFGRAAARAIRDGADMGQVVNARRGMRSPGDPFTREGTRRGHASTTLRRGQRRMTPDTIYRLNPKREDAIRALRDQGYILPGGQVPTGSLRGQQTGQASTGETAAQRRVREAARDWQDVLAGRNPYSSRAQERHGGARIGAQETPLTPQIAAQVEARYYAAVAARGELTEMRRLLRMAH